MPIDPHREAMKRHQLALAVEALMREEAVVNYYATRGKKVICADDKQTRALLKMTASEKVADVLIEMSPGHLVIAEVKGSDLDTAIEQLKSTAKRAAHLYNHITCKIYVRNKVPEGESADLRGGHLGYRALRVFHAGFPGEWLLYKYKDTGGHEPVRVGSEQVCIAFGPHV